MLSARESFTNTRCADSSCTTPVECRQQIITSRVSAAGCIYDTHCATISKLTACVWYVYLFPLFFSYFDFLTLYLIFPCNCCMPTVYSVTVRKLTYYNLKSVVFHPINSSNNNSSSSNNNNNNNNNNKIIITTTKRHH